MRQITLNVPDSQFAFFKKLIHSLNFVEVNDKKSAEDMLSTAQKETWTLIKTGFEEIKEVKQGKRQARPVQALFDELDAL